MAGRVRLELTKQSFGDFAPLLRPTYICARSVNHCLYSTAEYSAWRLTRGTSSGSPTDFYRLAQNWSYRVESNHLPMRVNRVTACRSPLRHQYDINYKLPRFRTLRIHLQLIKLVRSLPPSPALVVAVQALQSNV